MVLFISSLLLAWGLWFRLLSAVCFTALGAYLTMWSGALSLLGMDSMADLIEALKQPWEDLQLGHGCAATRIEGPLQPHQHWQHEQHEQQRQLSPIRRHLAAAASTARVQQQPYTSATHHGGSSGTPPKLPAPDSAGEQQQQQQQDWGHAAHSYAALSSPSASPRHRGRSSLASSACPSTASLAAEASHLRNSSSSGGGFSSPRLSLSGSHASSSNGGGGGGHRCSAAGAAAAAAAYAVLCSSSSSLPKEDAAAMVAAAVFVSGRLLEGGTGAAQSRSSWVLPPVDFDASEEQQQALLDQAPPEFLCPLGRVLMTDPVFTPSGFTYNRPCIEGFIEIHRCDPVASHTPLAPGQLCPNINLRDSLVSWLKAQGIRT